jgi:hypothetical protein
MRDQETHISEQDRGVDHWAELKKEVHDQAILDAEKALSEISKQAYHGHPMAPGFTVSQELVDMSAAEYFLTESFVKTDPAVRDELVQIYEKAFRERYFRGSREVQ